MSYQERVRKLSVELRKRGEAMERENPGATMSELLAKTFSGSEGSRLYREYRKLDDERRAYRVVEEEEPPPVAPTPAADLIGRFVHSKMASDHTLTRPQAMASVCREHVELYRRATEEHVRRANRGS